MSANAQDQVERMLALVPYLRVREGIHVEEVAQDFGVPPAQIVKDLKVLWYCGLPNSVTGDMIDIDMDALDEGGIVKLSNADYLTRPLRLAPHEALAMMVALRALREVSGTSQRETVDRALAKLEAATGDAAAPAHVVDIQVDQADAKIRTEVDRALAHQRRMHLAYYVPGRDETTQRDVDPIRLLFSEGKGYLEAYCHRAEEVRLFRLDRITGAEVLDQESCPPDGLGLHDLSQGLFQPDPEDPLAVLDLEPYARWVSEYYPTEGTEEIGDGRLRVRLRFSDPGWLQRLVLRLGGGATVVEPEDVARTVRTRAQAALAQYTA
jgi:proteasome accessory factor C